MVYVVEWGTGGGDDAQDKSGVDVIERVLLADGEYTECESFRISTWSSIPTYSKYVL